MVKRGLKPGELFVDSGRAYQVIRVLANGDYESKAVSSESRGAASVDAAPGQEEDAGSEIPVQDLKREVSVKSYTKREIQRMTKAKLTQVASEIGVAFTETEKTRAEVLKKLGL
ncbi:MAG: hypothetical protein J6A08_02610 [Lachnospiraceae bacterium]|nr:hypothetical protein [Lachnospiraceae bacterium]